MSFAFPPWSLTHEKRGRATDTGQQPPMMGDRPLIQVLSTVVLYTGLSLFFIDQLLLHNRFSHHHKEVTSSYEDKLQSPSYTW
jgi:hypothetical protein